MRKIFKNKQQYTGTASTQKGNKPFKNLAPYIAETPKVASNFKLTVMKLSFSFLYNNFNNKAGKSAVSCTHLPTYTTTNVVIVKE